MGLRLRLALHEKRSDGSLLVSTPSFAALLCSASPLQGRLFPLAFLLLLLLLLLLSFALRLTLLQLATLSKRALLSLLLLLLLLLLEA